MVWVHLIWRPQCWSPKKGGEKIEILEGLSSTSRWGADVTWQREWIGRSPIIEPPHPRSPRHKGFKLFLRRSTFVRTNQNTHTVKHIKWCHNIVSFLHNAFWNCPQTKFDRSKFYSKMALNIISLSRLVQINALNQRKKFSIKSSSR